MIVDFVKYMELFAKAWTPLHPLLRRIKRTKLQATLGLLPSGTSELLLYHLVALELAMATRGDCEKITGHLFHSLDKEAVYEVFSDLIVNYANACGDEDLVNLINSPDWAQICLSIDANDNELIRILKLLC